MRKISSFLAVMIIGCDPHGHINLPLGATPQPKPEAPDVRGEPSGHWVGETPRSGEPGVFNAILRLKEGFRPVIIFDAAPESPFNLEEENLDAAFKEIGFAHGVKTIKLGVEDNVPAEAVKKFENYLQRKGIELIKPGLPASPPGGSASAPGSG